MFKAWVGMEENSYCMQQAQIEAENSIDLDQLCGIKSSDGHSDVDEEEKEHKGDTSDMNVDETELETPSDDKVNEWETELKEIASEMLTAKGYDHLGTELESFVGKVKTAQRRVVSEAMAKKTDRAVQSKMDSY